MGCLSSKVAGVERAASERAEAFGLRGEDYQVLKRLGEGHEGSTYLVRVRASGEELAAKIMRRGGMLDEQYLLQEIVTQASLTHPFIVQLKEVLLTPSHVVMLLEYAKGGDFFKFVVSSTPHTDRLLFSENKARYFFRQIIGAVGYCHSKHVAHRDIKLANVLLDASSPPKIKLCDFGLSKLWQQMEDLNTHTAVGTPAYMPPEILTQLSKDTGYDPLSADVWSCGVFLYVMLLGKFPFQKLGQKVSLGTNFRNILCQIYIMHGAEWDGVAEQNGEAKDSGREPLVASAWEGANLSEECKDLLNKCLTIDAEQRISIPDILKHPWFRFRLLPEYERALGPELERETLREYKLRPVEEVTHCISGRNHLKLKNMIREAVFAPMGIKGEVQVWHPLRDSARPAA